MKLIWTRAVSDWANDRVYLPAKTIHLPCLRRVPLVPQVTEGHAFPYVVVSSVSAVRALPRLPNLQKRLGNSNFFCFGRQTATELMANGYRSLLCPVHSSAELVSYLVDHLPAATSIAVLSAQQPAFPVAESLRAKGFKISEFVLYQTITGACLPDGSAIGGKQRSIVASRKSVICFASPSAVRGFNGIFHGEISMLNENFRAVAIGKTTARQLEKSLPLIPCYLAKEFTLTNLIKTALRLTVKTTDTLTD